MSLFFAHSLIADGNMSVNWGPEDEVERNRTNFLAKHGLTREDVVILDLRHDDQMGIVGRNNAGTYVRADAVLTKEKDLVLMLLTADCCPVIFYDSQHETLALAHLSWQTTTLTLSKKVVTRMGSVFSTQPADLTIHIGPSARKESYVQQEVKQRTDRAWAPYLTEVPSGTAIDVVGFNVQQLRDAGVPSDHITVDPEDTIPSKRYFSHYRSVRTGEPEGRLATIAVLK